MRPYVTALAIIGLGAPAATAELPALKTEVAFPNLHFDRPVDLADPGDGSGLLFVAEQNGVIKSFPNESETSDLKPFLDLSNPVYSPSDGAHNEEGLLGLAFHPNYADNGQFFVYYSAKEGPTGRRSVVSRFRVSKDDPRVADPGSEERVWVGPPDPHGNHNGGCIVFGPDGTFYISLGDSGAADDPLTTGQKGSDFFGSILRIDVDHPEAGKPYGIPDDNPALRDEKLYGDWAPEVFCIGLRNVWRFSFDRADGTIWAGDVGQNLWEIVYVLQNGGNYGWSINEGSHRFRPRQVRSKVPITPPIWEYPHSIGKSITGGFVYRGDRLPELQGAYVFADYDSGRIWGLRRGEGDGSEPEVAEMIDLKSNPKLNVASFGQTPDGELLILAFDGRIHRLAPR